MNKSKTIKDPVVTLDMLQQTAEEDGDGLIIGVTDTVNQALADMMRDMHDRPHLKKSRTVNLKIEMKPKQTDVGVSVEFDVEVSAKSPNRKVYVTTGTIRTDGEFVLPGVTDKKQTNVFDAPHGNEDVDGMSSKLPN